ncbi:MAG: hypothetical protein WC518_03415 [Patescibacteria group bacterium]
MSKITNELEWLVDIYGHNYQKSVPDEVEKIKLSQLVSKLGFVYEKFRNAIDYNEEHLVRRNSLERLLKRQILFLQERRPQQISQTLIYEFIRAGYLPNNQLPETVIEEVATIIIKYLEIFNCLHGQRLANYGKLAAWLISLAACEINEYLVPQERETAMVNFMYSHLVDNLAFTKTKIEEKEKNLQIYLATLRTFSNADTVALNYGLLKLYLPNWRQADKNEIQSFCQNINIIKNKIEAHIKHSIGFQLTRTVRSQAVFFTVLNQLMQKNAGQLKEVLDDPKTLEEKIEEIALANYHRIRSKLMGTIFRVIIYIFFTKTILAFILELPYDYLFIKQVDWYALSVNVLFHPLLMFFLAMTIRVPGTKNTKIIIEEIKNIVYGTERKIGFKAKKSLKRGSFSYFVFNTIYLLMFIVSFGIIIKILNLIHFNIISGILFVFFLTIVSFFGFRLRNLAKQFSVLPRKDSLFNFLVDFISLPIIRVGRFFSTNFSKINIFLFILDFIIETPFKLLIEFLEKTVSFIKEKREEIAE